MNAPSAGDWVGGEPRLWTVSRQVLARAVRRRGVVVAIAAAGALAAVAWRATRPPAYVASLTFILAEGDLVGQANLPKPPSRIREYVTDVALGRERLLALMERHGISRRLRALDPSAAVASMREDLEVEVYRNYFIYEREAGDEPRTAQIVVTYKGDDREEARAVTHDAGALILESQASTRGRSIQAAQVADEAQARLERGRLRALRERRALLLDEAALSRSASSPRVLAEATSLQRQIDAASRRLRTLDGKIAALGLANEAELQQLGMTLRLVDESVRPLREKLHPLGAVALAAAGFLAILPIAALVLGAFDATVRTVDDLVSRGIPLLGSVPAFPGADALARRVRRPLR